MAATIVRTEETPVSRGEYDHYLNRSGGTRQKSFQGFLRAVQDTLRPERKKQATKAIHEVYGSQYVSPVQKAAMAEESGTVGGYLVPTDYSTKLLFAICEEAFLLPRATQVPMAARETSCPVVQARVASGTPGVPGFFGGMYFRWGSSTAPQETEPSFDQLNLTAWDLIGYSTVANSFLSDAGSDAEAKIIQLFAKAASWFLEYSFLNGTGSAQQMPVGVVGCPGQKLVPRQTTKTVTAQDITNMTAALLPFSWKNAIWACHPSLLIPIQQLSQYFINIELGGMHNLNPVPTGALATRPLYVTEKLPAPGTGVNGDIILFDPSLYVWGMRQDVVIDVSTDSAFKTNQTDFRVWLRGDGKPMTSQPITLPDQTTVVSPFVVLQGK